MDNEDFSANSGARVKALREGRGWSQNELARYMTQGLPDGDNIYAMTVKRIENGSRALKLAEAVLLADIFQTSVDDIAGRGRDEDVLYAEQSLALANKKLLHTSSGVIDSVAQYLADYWDYRALAEQVDLSQNPAMREAVNQGFFYSEFYMLLIFAVEKWQQAEVLSKIEDTDLFSEKTRSFPELDTLVQDSLGVTKTWGEQIGESGNFTPYSGGA